MDILNQCLMLLATSDPENQASSKDPNISQDITAFLMNPDSDPHHNQAVSEWKAISKAKGYHGSFPNWILEHNVEWYPRLPTIDYVQQILQ